MTYNFDPDRWYDNQRSLIDARRAAGTLDEEGLRKALQDLERRYEEMLERVGRSFQLPEGKVRNQDPTPES
jgi:hypothetical protein